MFLSMIWYDHILHHGRKYFCRYCLQAFRTAEKLKSHIKDCFKINGKKTIKMPKKGEYIKFKDWERKMKSPFMIYADFESILVTEDNPNQKIQMSLMLKNIKDMLFVVMVINCIIWW